MYKLGNTYSPDDYPDELKTRIVNKVTECIDDVLKNDMPKDEDECLNSLNNTEVKISTMIGDYPRKFIGQLLMAEYTKIREYKNKIKSMS